MTQFKQILFEYIQINKKSKTWHLTTANKPYYSIGEDFEMHIDSVAYNQAALKNLQIGNRKGFNGVCYNCT